MRELETRVDTLLGDGVSSRLFHGAVAEVWCGGVRIGAAAAGVTSPEGGAPAGPDTVYDIASLTKVFASAAAWRLVDRGALDLGAEVTALLDGKGPPAARVVDLLRHTSGLPDWRPYFETARTRGEVVLLALAEPQARSPGATAVYSDVGFIVLGETLERASGERLDSLVAREVAGPLGLVVTRYLPADGQRRTAIEGHVVAASARCEWRGRLLQGEVHDENCWAMEGCSAHAGLFSTAQEVARLGVDLLACRRGEGRLVSKDVALEVTTASVGGRTPGLDVPSGPDSAAGSLMSRRAFGHLGFTGCSLWCDPDRDLVVVLLSNRVQMDRNKLPMRAFRRRLHDAVVEQVDRS